MADPLAYPLTWPSLARRAKERRTNHPFAGITFDKARKSLREELNLLRATGATISTNVPLRGDGEPRSDAARYRIDDPGVAVYFTLNGKNLAMAVDRYWEIAANMRSLAMAISAMRMLERHGGGAMMEQAFDGFLALPAPGQAAPLGWRKLLGFAPGQAVTRADILTAYRNAAKVAHGQGSGSMAELVEARRQAEVEITT